MPLGTSSLARLQMLPFLGLKSTWRHWVEQGRVSLEAAVNRMVSGKLREGPRNEGETGTAALYVTHNNLQLGEVLSIDNVMTVAWTIDHCN